VATPILVTGLGRTGTTWVGKMLCLSSELNYIHEPFGFYKSPIRWPAKLPDGSFYICRDNEINSYQIVADVVRMKYPLRNRLSEMYENSGKLSFIPNTANLASQYARSLRARAHRATPLIKDPALFFSAPWLAQQFNMRVVITVRHPAAMVSSIKRLGWKVNFRRWRDQSLLMRDYLNPFAAELDEQCRRPQDVISQATLLWNMYYTVALRFKTENPSWLFVKHEDLARDPIGGFRELYQELNLTWDESVRKGVDEFTQPGNPREGAPTEIWTVKRDSRAMRRIWAERLTPEEIKRIRDSVGEVSQRYYSDSDW
jgi:hypothetical protein